MTQSGRHPTLAQRPRADVARGLLGQALGGHHLLDRDLALEQLIGRQPDRAHPTTTEFGPEPIASGDEKAGSGNLSGVVGNGHDHKISGRHRESFGRATREARPGRQRAMSNGVSTAASLSGLRTAYTPVTAPPTISSTNTESTTPRDEITSAGPPL